MYLIECSNALPFSIDLTQLKLIHFELTASWKVGDLLALSYLVEFYTSTCFNRLVDFARLFKHKCCITAVSFFMKC